MSAGRMYVRECGKGHELVAMVPGEREQRLAERAELAAEAIGEARLANLGSRLYVALTNAHREMCDFAFAQAMAASRALGNAIAQDFTVTCAGCLERLDIEATEELGNERFCRQCAAETRAEMADLARSDEYDYRYDRGL